MAIPAAIIGVLQNDGYLGDYGLTLGVAWLFVFMTIIYFTIHGGKLDNIKLSSAYTAASARFLQFLGVSLTLALLALPIFLSLFGLFLSLPIFGLPPIIFLPLSILSFLLSSYLLARFGMSQVISVAESLSVVQSLKLSSEITKKNRWRIFFGTFVVILVFLVLLTLVQFLVGLNQSLAQNQIFSAAVYAVEAAILVPLFFIFQSEIYKELNGKA
ncbi:MAG: hypothetical protein WCP56_00125 [Candidatus Saccharibacteria bacterium]